MHPVRLACDPSLGKLAKWLRVLGFDTFYRNAIDDARLLSERDSGRLILTRKRSLSGKAGVLLIEPDAPEKQLLQVLRALKLKAPEPRLSRCLRCNSELVTATPAEVEGKVPEHVLATVSEFRRCPRCERVYWPGTHVQRMRSRLARLVGQGI